MMIETSTPLPETPFGSYGTFEGYDVTDNWTDEDWAEYDRHVAEDMARHDEMMDDYWPSPEDFHGEEPF